MPKRFASIWFPYLLTDWISIRRPELKAAPFVFVVADHGRLMVSAVSPAAESQGLQPGMVAADAKAAVPYLQVLDEAEGKRGSLLKRIGLWCIRYSPVTAVDGSDGLLLDISGCSHLWGGEQAYCSRMMEDFKSKGYQLRIAVADTPGAAWALARYGQAPVVIQTGISLDALRGLPAAALRLPGLIAGKLEKLGLHTIGSFAAMPRSVLRRRFGEQLLLRLDQAAGLLAEPLEALHEFQGYFQHLPCLEPIRTRKAIDMAIQTLLEGLCRQLKADGQGLRSALLKAYRVDGRLEQLSIGTNRPSYHIAHLFRLLEIKIQLLRPGLGFEVFTLEAVRVEPVPAMQESIWTTKKANDHTAIAELLDKISGRLGNDSIYRYLPAEHYWPERSVRRSSSLDEQSAAVWREDKPRPVRLLSRPEPIQVAAPVPDYPPIVFVHRGRRHAVKKADGPERIEREWWLEEGEHRDYYYVEDEQGQRYWIYRSGHYSGESKDWFLHGFFG